MSWSERHGCAMALYAACQRHMMVQYCCGRGSTTSHFVSASYFDRKPSDFKCVVILDGFVRCKITRAASVASGMPHHE